MENKESVTCASPKLPVCCNSEECIIKNGSDVLMHLGSHRHLNLCATFTTWRRQSLKLFTWLSYESCWYFANVRGDGVPNGYFSFFHFSFIFVSVKHEAQIMFCCLLNEDILLRPDLVCSVLVIFHLLAYMFLNLSLVWTRHCSVCVWFS